MNEAIRILKRELEKLEDQIARVDAESTSLEASGLRFFDGEAILQARSHSAGLKVRRDEIVASLIVIGGSPMMAHDFSKGPAKEVTIAFEATQRVRTPVPVTVDGFPSSVAIRMRFEIVAANVERTPTGYTGTIDAFVQERDGKVNAMPLRFRREFTHEQACGFAVDDIIRTMLHDFVAHEADEAITVAGKRVFDPHFADHVPESVRRVMLQTKPPIRFT